MKATGYRSGRNTGIGLYVVSEAKSVIPVRRGSTKTNDLLIHIRAASGLYCDVEVTAAGTTLSNARHGRG
ncbi:hypothetical protein GXP70_29145 [Paenibacillus lycopersici]|uniref:Uncharacterized protein n=1 Tax=Paenibacillus lycopersici TaxID=2704462 RepID=A0A6C0G6E5_9BACL|nr:hypothetical protein [Paenibacillus lycopersici]QHT63619.1 hypothetical protein GXP70_29145 [Paenibacillus lycopersici]